MMNRSLKTLRGREVYATERALCRLGNTDALLFLCRAFAYDDIKITYKKNALCIALETENDRNYPSKLYNLIGICTSNSIELDAGVVEYGAI